MIDRLPPNARFGVAGKATGVSSYRTHEVASTSGSAEWSDGSKRPPAPDDPYREGRFVEKLVCQKEDMSKTNASKTGSIENGNVKKLIESFMTSRTGFPNSICPHNYRIRD